MENTERVIHGSRRSEIKLLKTFLIIFVILVFKYTAFSGKTDLQKRSVSFSISIAKLSFDFGFNSY